ncbi:uncharacterized protein PODANS_5_1335 [Podospora anserina S mat+]|uniref:Podospora anserina S mat+ genomic DNA chromosome 5, supercontig 1 n=1 Tax=Podospora anserina (strain S / ATCC MYA-4624 / DSM 980 / FGSC 10383) TaxID=515849 RepID=B2AEW2_PODAN|nr:uncharacterized protein PODANS_5_1335 [Podospora anserina S mat+]CAP61979.1 unnamed protein product [Podospora anserina S mat+]CDP29055.1 Putative protein of unknown function [Podospora anserina S mat+]
MPNRLLPKPSNGFTNPDDTIKDLFLGWYLNSISNLVTKLVIPRSASIIRLGQRVESALCIPKSIWVFHPPPIEPGMTDEELGLAVEGFVSFGTLAPSPGFALTILN